MERTKKYDLVIGGIRFAADLPIADDSTHGVEARYLIALERETVRVLCEEGQPTGDGFRFLRSRSGLARSDLAQSEGSFRPLARLFGVTLEEYSAWENGSLAIPLPAWELMVTIAHEYVFSQSTLTVDRMRKRIDGADRPMTQYRVPVVELEEAARAAKGS